LIPYETNDLPPRLKSLNWSPSKVETVAVPPLGSQAESLTDQTLANLGQTLGQERAQLLMGDALARKDGTACDPWVGVCLEVASRPQLLTAMVSVSPSNPGYVGVFRNGQTVSAGLPGSGAATNKVRLLGLPTALSARFFDPWLNRLGLINAETQTGP
jgi:hypothetical protein